MSIDAATIVVPPLDDLPEGEAFDIVKPSVETSYAALQSIADAINTQMRDCYFACSQALDGCWSCFQSQLNDLEQQSLSVMSKVTDKGVTYFNGIMGNIAEVAGAAGIQLAAISQGDSPAFTPPVPGLGASPGDGPVPGGVIPIIQPIIEPPPPGPPILGQPCLQVPPNGQCPPGWYLSNGRCCPIPQCGPGSHWDSVRQQCVPDQLGHCTPPQHFSPELNACSPGCSDATANAAWSQVGLTGPIVRCGEQVNPDGSAILPCIDASPSDVTNPNCCQVNFQGDLGNNTPPQQICNPGGPGGGTQSCDSCIGDQQLAHKPSNNSPGFMQWSCGVDGVVKSVDAVETPSIGSDLITLTQMLGLEGVQGDSALWAFFKGVATANPLKIFTSGVSGFFSAFAGMLDSVLGATSFTTCGNETSYATMRTWNALIGLIDKYAGIFPQNELQSFRYLINASCPYLIPSVHEADSLYYAKEATSEQWEAIVKAHGYCPEWREKIRDLGQARPTVADAVILKNRKKINDDEYNHLLELNGYDTKNWSDSPNDLFQQIPNGPQVLDFAAKGLYDTAFINKWELDSGNEVLNDDTVNDALQAAGMPQDLAQQIWRSHWHHLSLGEIRQLLIRLRPDRRDVNDPLPGVDFTEDEAKDLLKYSGIPSGQVDMLLAMRYTPISWRHIRLAYIHGDLDDDDVKDAYKGIGYSDNAVDVISKAFIADAAPKKAEAQGILPEKEIRKGFMESVVNRDLAIALLSQLNIDFTIASNKVSSWELERDIAERDAIVKALKRRYMRGDFDNSDAQTNLVQNGVDAQRASDMVNMWDNQREASTKIPAVAMLCKWWSNGLISSQQYVHRLQNLNWSLADAVNMSQSCFIDKSRRDAKEAIAELEKLARQQEKKAREQLKLIKQRFPCKQKTKPDCPQGIFPPV